MATFKDESGRQWAVRVDVSTIKHVRDAVDVNLGDISKASDNFIQLADDPCLLANVLFVVCEKQAKERNISDEDFGELLLGDVIFDASMALEEAITAFFPLAKRSLLQRLRKKIDRVQDMGREMISERLEDPALEAKIQAEMREKMKNLLTHSNSASSLPVKSG